MTDRRAPSAEELFRRYGDVEARLTAPLSERMLDLAEVGPGKRVLDLATGPGEPALRAARRVAPEGLVVGVDVDAAVLDIARQKARTEGLTNVELRAADAAVARDLPAGFFHTVTARWGLMYMAAPVAALANAHAALVPDGVVVAALWAEPERTPYYTLPRRLLAPYREIPPIDPEAPGPFRHADVGRITRDFAAAGFSIEHVEEMEVTVFETEVHAEMVEWVRTVGLTRLLNGLPEDHQRAWEADLVAELRRQSDGESVRLGGVTRIVKARRS